MVDDERLAEPFSIGSLRKVGSQTFTDIWCSFPTHSSQADAAASLDVPARALAYTLDVRIHPDHSLEGRAEIQLESRSAQDRVISFGLSRWLAVTGVEDDHGRNITVIGGQPPGRGPGGAARLRSRRSRASPPLPGRRTLSLDFQVSRQRYRRRRERSAVRRCAGKLVPQH